MQAFPELQVSEGPESYIPLLYGFKIFGQKGSKYEVKYDEYGTAVNRDEIDKVLKNKNTDAYD